MSCSRSQFSRLSRKMEKIARIFVPDLLLVFHQYPDEKMGDCLGWCDQIREGAYHIVVCETLSEAHTTEVLIHEVAHALQWETSGDATGLHGPEWGLCYALMYHRFFEDKGNKIRPGSQSDKTITVLSEMYDAEMDKRQKYKKKFESSRKTCSTTSRT